MLLFGLISHLELYLRALVRERAPWPKWLELLKPERRRELSRKLNDLKNARLELDPLEFTNFGDVIDLLATHPDFSGGFRRETEAIKNLRNDIAHAKTYINSAGDVPQFVDRFNYIREWIDHTSRALKAAR
jgi:hypothetical protein